MSSVLSRFKRVFQTFNQMTIFDVPVAAQQQFLESLPEPKDDIERSYLQYRCQNRLMKRGMPLLLNAAAIPLSLAYRFKLRSRTENGDKPAGGERTAVLLYADRDTIVPDSLREEFDITRIPDFQGRLRLTAEDEAYLRELRRRYPFAFYFRLKCTLKIAMYRDAITRFAPKAIICSSEYSFTSSLLTDYCQRQGIIHINIMHGDKAYDIRDTFFSFDRCYVWDRHYVDLFRDLRAQPEQFITELPPSMRLPRRESSWERVDATYYLANETEEQIRTILNSLSVLSRQGKKVALRMHPLYPEHAKLLYENPYGLLVEEPRDVPIEDSLLRTGCVISLFSTVLLQASANGIPIVIDDMTDHARYLALRSLRILAMEKEHSLLSDLVKQEPA